MHNLKQSQATKLYKEKAHFIFDTKKKNLFFLKGLLTREVCCTQSDQYAFSSLPNRCF